MPVHIHNHSWCIPQSFSNYFQIHALIQQNSYPLLGIPYIMIEWMPRFKPHYMRWEKFEKKRAELKRLIYRYVDLWMASIRY